MSDKKIRRTLSYGLASGANPDLFSILARAVSRERCVEHDDVAEVDAVGDDVIAVSACCTILLQRVERSIALSDSARHLADLSLSRGVLRDHAQQNSEGEREK